MKNDAHQKERNNNTNIKKNSSRDTVSLGSAVKLIRERDNNFGSSSLFGILSNGGVTAFIITEYGRVPIPQTYWPAITIEELPRLHVLNWLSVKYRDLLPLATMRVVAARKFLRELDNRDGGSAFETNYPDLAMWLRRDPTKGITLESDAMCDELDELLAALAHSSTKKYVPRLLKTDIDPYIGGSNGLPKQKTGPKLNQMPDEFWFELLTYYTPFKNKKLVKTISREMATWIKSFAEKNSLKASEYNEAQIKKIVHSINGIGKGRVENKRQQPSN